MKCFCGCGRQVAFSMRRTNKWGGQLSGDARRVQAMLDRGLVSPNAATFLAQANDWCERFVVSVHAGIKLDRQQPGTSRAYLRWLRGVRPFVGQHGVSYLGKQVRDAHMTTDEALAAMDRGEWDPYAAVQLPAPGAAAEPG